MNTAAEDKKQRKLKITSSLRKNIDKCGDNIKQLELLHKILIGFEKGRFSGLGGSRIGPKKFRDDHCNRIIKAIEKCEKNCKKDPKFAETLIKDIYNSETLYYKERKEAGI